VERACKRHEDWTTLAAVTDDEDKIDTEHEQRRKQAEIIERQRRDELLTAGLRTG
jgi:hypothetical protein